MLKRFSSLQIEHLVSIGIMIISLGLFLLFSVDGLLQSTSAVFAFLALLPVLYVRLILKRSWKDLVPALPQISAYSMLTTLCATVLGMGGMVAIALSPYSDAYIAQMTPVFSTFLSFTAYEIGFLLPYLSIIIFFGVQIVGVLGLNQRTSLFLSVALVCIILLVGLPIPLLCIPLIAMILSFFAYRGEYNTLTILLTLFLTLLAYDTSVSSLITRT